MKSFAKKFADILSGSAKGGDVQKPEILEENAQSFASLLARRTEKNGVSERLIREVVMPLGLEQHPAYEPKENDLGNQFNRLRNIDLGR
jgi:hypothetical protein